MTSPTYAVKPLSIQARVIDAVTPLDAVSGAHLKAAGIDAVVQYGPTMDKARLASILSTGLGFMLIGGYADKPDTWSPNAGLGRTEGQTSVVRAKSMGYLPGAVLWCDIETPDPTAAASDVMGYGNAWAAEVAAAGYLPGVYVGYNCRVSAAQLFSMRFVRYWKSMSAQMPEPACGWCMIQLYAPNQVCAGVQVDFDIAQQDFQTRSAMAMFQTG